MVPERDADSWGTASSDDPAEQSLSDVIREAERRVSRVEDDERAQIAIRVAPPGFRAIMGQLAHEDRVSYSRFARHAIQHGLAILDARPDVEAMRWAYDQTRADAMSRGDPDALRRLNQTMPYEFQISQDFRTTFSVSRETAARVSELAMVSGIEQPRLAVVAALVGLITLPNNRGYRGGVLLEIEAFYRHVRLRTRILLLGEGAGSGQSERRRLKR